MDTIPSGDAGSISQDPENELWRERERLNDAAVARDKAFPRDDPPRVTVRYRRTTPPVPYPHDWLDWAEERDPVTDEPLRHEKLRAAFYDALYDCCTEVTPEVQTAMRRLEKLTTAIVSGKKSKRGQITGRYGLENQPGSLDLAHWLEDYRLQTMPGIGPDILSSIGALHKARIMGAKTPFRLRVYPPRGPGAPPTVAPHGWFSHDPGHRTWTGGPDLDSIDITIQGSWRMNARTQTQRAVREAVLADIERLLDEQVSRVFQEAGTLDVRAEGRPQTTQHMRWLVLFHFPYLSGRARTPDEVLKDERELLTCTQRTEPHRLEEVDADTPYRAARNLAGRLGLPFKRTPGRPPKPADEGCSCGA